MVQHVENIEQEFQLLALELQRYLSIEQIHQWARETEFMKRKTKVKPEDFLLLCSFLGESFGEKTLVELCGQLSMTFQVDITAEGLNQRFNAKAVEFIKCLFHALLKKQMIGSLPIVENQRFKRIRILDSTSFDVNSLYPDYKGPNGSGTKIQLEYEVISGGFLNLEIQEGVESDTSFPMIIKDDIQPRDLCLRDLGYFSIDNLKDIEEKGGYFLSI